MFIPHVFLSLSLLSYTSLAKTSSATFQFPIEDGLIVKTIDTVVLQWTSNYAAAWMEMWCESPAGGVVIG